MNSLDSLQPMAYPVGLKPVVASPKEQRLPPPKLTDPTALMGIRRLL